MAKPTWIWVTIPSQISVISSLGWELIRSDCGFPLTVIGTLTTVCSG